MDRIKQIKMYGMDRYLEVIEQVHEDLGLCSDDMEIKLILTEALTNAFIHGNERKKEKPIFLRYMRENEFIYFEIEDDGKGFPFRKPQPIEEVDLFCEAGRGLPMIQALSEHLEYKGNTLYVKKKISIRN